MTDSNGLTVTAVGDISLSRRLTMGSDNELQGLVEEADASLANLESAIIADESTPAAYNNGLYLHSSPWALDELDAYGFNMFSAATNHTGDYLQDGMHQTMEELKARNLCYAGLGRDMPNARSPAYLDTPSGRVGLVAATSTVKRGTQAGPRSRSQQSRAGVAPLRHRTSYRVTESQLEALREISEQVGFEEMKESFSIPTGSKESLMLVDIDSGITFPFVLDDEPAIDRQLVPQDAKALIQEVARAEKRSDYVVASLHAHEGAHGMFNDQTVPTFLRSIAHDCVRAGADMVVGHGPHVLRGIEVFDGAPIFYSLGNFALQFETSTDFPAEMYEKHGVDPDASSVTLVDRMINDSDKLDVLADLRKTRLTVLPMVSFDERPQVSLYPVDLGVDEETYRRGDPRLADGEVADEIFSDLERLSEPFGTEIQRDGNSATLSIPTTA